MTDVLSVGIDPERPFLEELTRKTGESSHIAIYSNGRSLLIDKEDSSEVIFVNMDVGRSEPLNCTALGKALLLQMNRKKTGDLLAGKMERYTKNTITGIKEFLNELEKVRQKGYAFDNEEYRGGVRCAASPIYDNKGKIVAAIGVSGPVSRISSGKLEGFGLMVKSAAGRLSAKLGYKCSR